MRHRKKPDPDERWRHPVTTSFQYMVRVMVASCCLDTIRVNRVEYRV